jgi:cell division protein FtsQ
VTSTLPPGTQPPREVAVDPRIWARRIAVQRELGRRRLRVLVVAASALATLGGAYLLVGSPLLDVDHVRVSGVELSDPDAVLDAAGVARGTALARLDTGAVERRVEALPWVARASVQRRFPGTVRIVLTERAPRAFVRRDDGGVVLVAGDGTVLGPVAAPPPGLVEVLGVRRTPAPGSLLSPPLAAGARDAMPGAIAARVTAVVLGEAGTASLRLDGGGEIRLGTLAELRAKGGAALAVLETLAPGARLDYVDVSVPANPSLRTS